MTVVSAWVVIKTTGYVVLRNCVYAWQGKPLCHVDLVDVLY